MAQNKRRSDVERKLAERAVLIAFTRIDKLYTTKAYVYTPGKYVKYKPGKRFIIFKHIYCFLNYMFMVNEAIWRWEKSKTFNKHMC